MFHCLLVLWPQFLFIYLEKAEKKVVFSVFFPGKYWEPAWLKSPHLPSWSTEQLVEHVGQVGGRLDSTVLLNALWDLRMQYLNFRDSTASWWKPSLPVTSCNFNIPSPTGVTFHSWAIHSHLGLLSSQFCGCLIVLLVALFSFEE